MNFTRATRGLSFFAFLFASIYYSHAAGLPGSECHVSYEKQTKLFYATKDNTEEMVENQKIMTEVTSGGYDLEKCKDKCTKYQLLDSCKTVIMFWSKGEKIGSYEGCYLADEGLDDLTSKATKYLTESDSEEHDTVFEIHTRICEDENKIGGDGSGMGNAAESIHFAQGWLVAFGGLVALVLLDRS